MKPLSTNVFKPMTKRTEQRRRTLAVICAGALAPLTAFAPLTSFAQQQTKIWRIGYLSPGTEASQRPRLAAFRAGLRELGYIEGRNLAFEFRWGEYNNDRLPALAAELVATKVDFIITHGTDAPLAASRATKTIPIVMASAGDVVALGLVPSLARPGGNITGSIFFVLELNAKRLELIKEAVPRINRVAVLAARGSVTTPGLIKVMEQAAKALKVSVQLFEVGGPAEFESAFAAMVKQRIHAVVVADHPLLVSHARAIADIALAKRMPSIGFSELAEAGGAFSYGVNFAGMWHRAAYFVDKIAKGAKPGEIPIEQPTRFESIINMKTAKALGIKIPEATLLRSTKVIE